ncbi:hypothetical protein [Agarivorans sp. Alg241-V36]|nr:hypothetical protein [Agarivorans sp. Alg241-V36]
MLTILDLSGAIWLVTQSLASKGLNKKGDDQTGLIIASGLRANDWYAS